MIIQNKYSKTTTSEKTNKGSARFYKEEVSRLCDSEMNESLYFLIHFEHTL